MATRSSTWLHAGSLQAAAKDCFLPRAPRASIAIHASARIAARARRAARSRGGARGRRARGRPQLRALP
jgi:hypothetical protein